MTKEPGKSKICSMGQQAEDQERADEVETEAQRGEVTCPRANGSEKRSQNLDPSKLSLRAYAANCCSLWPWHDEAITVSVPLLSF